MNDARAILAMISLLGSFGLGIYQLAIDHPDGANIPTWSAAIAATVTTFYFANRSNEHTIDRVTNGHDKAPRDPAERTRREDL